MRFPFKHCLSLLFAWPLSLYAKPIPLDGVAVMVNESIITRQEMNKHLQEWEHRAQAMGQPLPDETTLKKQVLEELILTEIQIQQAKKTGIEIDEDTLDHAIQQMAAQNNLSLTAMRETLEQTGIPFDHYRESIRRQMMIAKLQQRDIQNTIQVSEQEIDQFLRSPNGFGSDTTEYRIGHILVAVSEHPTSEEWTNAYQKAHRCWQSLKEGADFTQMAYSENSWAGDLGFRRRTELPIWFEKIVPTLKPNEIPEPIRSPNGFHLITLFEKRQIQPTTVSIDKTLLRQILIKTNTTVSDNDARNKLTQLRASLLEGADFAQVAQTHSADLASASQGGLLGWVAPEALLPEFRDTINQLPLHTLSTPFKTALGWHLVEVLDRRLKTPEAQLRMEAHNALQRRKLEEKQQAWLRELRDEAFVQYYDS